MRHDDVRHEHESFATVSWSRVSGQQWFFGTPIESSHYISLSIQPANITRGLGQDWIHGHIDPLCEVRMTESQWAQFICTPNAGTGTPCTLEQTRHVGGERRKYENPPHLESEASAIRTDFKKRVREAMSDIEQSRDSLEEMLSEFKLSAARKGKITEGIDQIQRLFTDSMPFLAKCSEEATEAAVATAKTEIAV